MSNENQPQKGISWPGLAVGFFMAAFLFFCLFLKQCGRTKEAVLTSHSLADEVVTLRSDKASLTQLAINQRQAAKQAMATLNSRLEANKRTAQTTPARLVSTSVRDNLKTGGFLPVAYQPDTSNRTAVVVYDSVENRALLESTGLVSVERSAWNQLADGYTRLQQDSTQAATRLAVCDSLKTAETTQRVIAQQQVDHYRGKTLAGKAIRKGRDGLTFIGAITVLVTAVRLFL